VRAGSIPNTIGIALMGIRFRHGSLVK
jgi:hypothetical protein